ncbi:MAG: FGGY-family carbohydrate kinase [Planctomycetota bacterium]
MSVIGLDIGTTGCKAIIFDDQWKIAGQSSREYPILTPQGGWAEQDAELVWSLALESLGEAVSQNRADSPTALALSAQGEAVMPVDADGVPLRHAILGMDTRTTAENRRLAETFGPEKLFRRTGMPMHTMNTITKLLWLKAHEPELYRSAHRFLLYEDYFLRRLGGRAVTSHCLASRTQMYDLETATWAEDILDRCQIDASRLAELPTEVDTVVGTLDKAIAKQLGLGSEVALVSGGHDQACAALGSGVIEPGLAMVSTGTAEVVEVATSTPVLNESLRKGNISVYRHVVPGLYLAMTLNHSGGLLLRWFRDTLCRDKSELASRTKRDAYDLILADASAEPTDLMVLPHFAGAGTPSLDTTSRGAILGMSFATTQADIAKAILEGLTFELRVNLDLLRSAGIDISELRAVGGGARSDMWLQMAAILASVAVGADPDLSSAVERAVRLGQRIEPARKDSGLYESRYQLFKELHPRLSPLNRELGRT